MPPRAHPPTHPPTIHLQGTAGPTKVAAERTLARVMTLDKGIEPALAWAPSGGPLVRTIMQVLVLSFCLGACWAEWQLLAWAPSGGPLVRITMQVFGLVSEWLGVACLRRC